MGLSGKVGNEILSFIKVREFFSPVLPTTLHYKDFSTVDGVILDITKPSLDLLALFFLDTSTSNSKV
jgi:hypothetical protein